MPSPRLSPRSVQSHSRRAHRRQPIYDEKAFGAGAISGEPAVHHLICLGSRKNEQWQAGDRLILWKFSRRLPFRIHLVGETCGLRHYPPPISWVPG